MLNSSDAVSGAEDYQDLSLPVFFQSGRMLCFVCSIWHFSVVPASNKLWSGRRENKRGGLHSQTRAHQSITAAANTRSRQEYNSSSST